MSFIIFFGPPNLIPKFKQASVLLIYRRDIKLLFSPCYVLIPSLQFCISIIIINLPPFPHHLFYSRSPVLGAGPGQDWEHWVLALLLPVRCHHSPVTGGCCGKRLANHERDPLERHRRHCPHLHPPRGLATAALFVRESRAPVQAPCSSGQSKNCWPCSLCFLPSGIDQLLRFSHSLLSSCRGVLLLVLHASSSPRSSCSASCPQHPEQGWAAWGCPCVPGAARAFIQLSDQPCSSSASL